MIILAIPVVENALNSIAEAIAGIWGFCEGVANFLGTTMELVTLYAEQLTQYIKILPEMAGILPVVISVPLMLFALVQMVKVMLYGG